ncbi:glycosyltransferase family 4 protein [Devosia sp. SD17-2]|uniref:glycosyltransferase family 4 protein n=1 Tax=Devosia sp. SD17-2 TaxID=2976459 RepID=UPI0023D87BA9|nr:glycosyltransferase family 4 protein [Devosia sp. SD17-2]WEJ33133.1 glycosyltransferase family 4 protein [Devosia sp. SD17-2]
MKILALTSEFPPFVGGIGTYAAELARAATELGHEIVLAAPDYGGDHKATDHANYPYEIIRYPGGPHRAKNLPAKIALVRRLVHAKQYDVVHAIDWPFFLPAALMARHLPRLYTLCGSEIADMAHPMRRAAISACGVFRGDVRVLAISQFTRDLFRQNFPAVPQGQTEIVHLGVGADWLVHRRTPGLLEKLGLPPDRLIVLTLARVTRRKGHLTAIAALDRLPQNLQQRLTYVIAGPDCEADYRSELEAAMEASAVQILRLRDLDRAGVMALCAASDIFCLPGGPADGKVEGFGLVLLEAGSQGLPLVAGDVGGVAEVVEDGISGIVVPIEDPAALAEALGRLVTDPDLRTRLGQGARARAVALSWQRCAALTYGPSAG